MAGLSSEQRTLLEQRYCAFGHRIDGANYPTPEGACPRCIWPQFTEELDRSQWLLLSESAQPRAPLHPSMTSM